MAAAIRVSFTICPTPCNRNSNVLSASLNKTFPSIFPFGHSDFHSLAFVPVYKIIHFFFNIYSFNNVLSKHFPTPYNRKYNVLSASLNNTFPLSSLQHILLTVVSASKTKFIKEEIPVVA